MAKSEQIASSKPPPISIQPRPGPTWERTRLCPIPLFLLNRVISGYPSQIYGALQGNGHVYLINPSGILIGPSGQINVHSFVGSTHNLTDGNFLQSAAMRLAGDSTASVRNQGSIQALGG